MNLHDALHERFLKILNITRAKPSFRHLTGVTTSFLTTIPFENVSKIYYLHKYGLKYIPDYEMYLDGILENRFGGTCYSNNYYLNQLLIYLGYDARLCGADMNNPDVHIINVVSLNGRKYLVDAGYAAPFLKPIHLDSKAAFKLSLGHDHYDLSYNSKESVFRMSLERNGEAKHGYRFKTKPRTIDQFDYVIKDSFRDSATFLNSILLVRFEPEASVMIHNNSLIESRRSDVKTKYLKDQTQIIETIKDRFGIPQQITGQVLSSVGTLEDAWN